MKKCFFLLVIIFFNIKAHAFNIIRDDEIEEIIKETASPIIKATNFDPKTVKIYIILDKEINAFTAGGRNIFINSGLITSFNDPSVIQGVIAHELGHIVAGHIIQKKNQIEELQKSALMYNVLGLIGGIATGSMELLVAGATGGSHIATRQYLKYSRQQENEADRISLQLLNKAHIPKRGLIELLQKLMKDQQSFHPDPYTITHPLSSARIDHIKNFKFTEETIEPSPSFLIKFESMLTKLRAFTYKPESVILESEKYTNPKMKEYANAIAYYRLNKLSNSLEQIKLLLKSDPSNPYILELAGQVYMKDGKFFDASNSYQKACDNLKKSSLLKFQLAVSKIHEADKNHNHKLYQEAISLLTSLSNDINNENAQIYYYLSVAYGKIGNIGGAKLSLAEKAFLLGNQRSAKVLAEQALHLLKPGTALYSKAKELIQDLDSK